MLAAISASAQLDQSQAVSTHYQSAVDLEKKSRVDDAIAEYRKAINETPYHADSHYNLGTTRAHAQNFYRRFNCALTIPITTTTWVLS